MRKPAIPSNPKTPGREKFDGSVKECLEAIMGRRGARVEPLPANATMDDVIAKVNELVELLQ